MELVIRTTQFILALSMLVGIHEFGHFIVARIFGIRVEKFYIFFDPWFSIAKWRYKGTEYGIGWLPLGGYVKIAGMVDESMDKEQIAQEPKADEYRAKPAWQRLCVSIAGVVMNFLLAIGIYTTVSYMYGEQYTANEDVKWGYNYADAVEQMGFEDGDKIISIDGKIVERYTDILPALLITDSDKRVIIERASERKLIRIPLESLISLRKDKELLPGLITPRRPYIIDSTLLATSAALERDDQVIGFNKTYIFDSEILIDSIRNRKDGIAPLIVLRQNDTLRFDIPVNYEGRIGVLIKEAIPMRSRNYTVWSAIPAGFVRTGQSIASYWSQLSKIVKPESELYKEVGGFVSIAGIFGTQWNWFDFWHKVAFFSIMLAVLNILPIPALDGGHVAICLWEIATKKKPNEKVLEILQYIGMILILGLFVFANGSDLFRLLK